MIDAFNEIFTPIAEDLREEIQNIFVSGEHKESPPSFPCATIEEKDNSTYTPSKDSSLKENHANLMYEVNAYSNLSNGKRTQCRKIMSIIDKKFQEMGFTRFVCTPVSNIKEATIYRMVARYEAVISTDHIIYRR